MGRPKIESDITKSCRFTFRMTPKTRDQLTFLARQTKQSKTEVIEKALNIYNNMVKQRGDY